MITAVKNRFENTLSMDINKSLKMIYIFSIISLGVCFALYLYFVGAITFSIVKEEGLKKETKTLMSSIAQEELSYLTAQRMMNEEYAQEIGLIPAKHLSFASSQKAIAWNVAE